MFEVGVGTHQLAQLVASTLRDSKQFPLILGGDHSIGIGSLAGILEVHPDFGVLWIDAHADINTPYITESGNMHGMPIGFIMDPILDRTFEQFKGTNKNIIIPSHASSAVPGFEWLQSTFRNRLQPNQLVYVGLRDVDIAERKLITSLGIQAYTMTDIDRKYILNSLLVAFNAFFNIYFICSSSVSSLFDLKGMGLVTSLTWRCNT
jgi:arginase